MRGIEVSTNAAKWSKVKWRS